MTDRTLDELRAGVAELARPAWRRRRIRLLPTVPDVPHQRLKCDVGWLRLATPDEVVAPWIEMFGTWEPAEGATVRSWLRSGMTMIDVGAHAGYYARLASSLVGHRGRVIAVEPDPINFALLVRNLRDRRIRNVAALQAAAWSQPATLELVRSAINTGDHRVRPTAAPTPDSVMGVALDDVIPSSMHVDVVKVDTQGVDHFAIEGMRRLIERCRPKMVVEFWPEGIREDASAIPAQYRELGYSIRALEAEIAPDAPGAEIVAAADADPHGFLTLVLEPAELQG